MSAIAAAGVLSGGLGVAKFFSGKSQTKKAEELAASNKFIAQQMPGQVTLATNLAAQNYYNGMPGTAAAQQRIGQNSANAFQAASQGASSGGDLLDLGAKINQGQQAATNQLAQQSAQYKAQALGGYENALNNEGDWEGRLYNNNVLTPYNNKANTASAMYGAGQQNMYSGLDQVGTAALGYASAKQADNLYGNTAIDPSTGIAGGLAAAKIRRGRW